MIRRYTHLPIDMIEVIILDFAYEQFGGIDFLQIRPVPGTRHFLSSDREIEIEADLSPEEELILELSIDELLYDNVEIKI